MVGGPCRRGLDWKPRAFWGAGILGGVWNGRTGETSKTRGGRASGGPGGLSGVVRSGGGGARSPLRSGPGQCGTSGRAHGRPGGSSRCHPPQWTVPSHSPGGKRKRHWGEGACVPPLPRLYIRKARKAGMPHGSGPASSPSGSLLPPCPPPVLSPHFYYPLSLPSPRPPTQGGAVGRSCFQGTRPKVPPLHPSPLYSGSPSFSTWTPALPHRSVVRYRPSVISLSRFIHNSVTPTDPRPRLSCTDRSISAGQAWALPLAAPKALVAGPAQPHSPHPTPQPRGAPGTPTSHL